MTRDWNAMADDEFRSMLRSEFEDNYPAALRFPPRRLLWHEQHDWYLRMSEMGWIAPNWPARHGGMGLSPAKMLIFLEEQERCGIARFQDHGIWMIGPVLLRFGTPEQQQRFLPPILRCDHRYCQGYSEPDSGSDLASLRTTARRAGDAYIVTGTKIWTTMAHDSTHMFLLARTGHDGPKQRTISFFLLDLASPGVTVPRSGTWPGRTSCARSSSTGSRSRPTTSWARRTRAGPSGSRSSGSNESTSAAPSCPRPACACWSP
jgi:hypothetical protein